MFRRKKIRGVVLEFNGIKYPITFGDDFTIVSKYDHLDWVVEMQTKQHIRVVESF